MNQELWEEVYREYSPGLFSYAVYLTGNRSDAEDLVQETFVRALLSWNGKGNIRPWLYTVMRNIFIDETRRRKRFVQNSEEILKDHADPSEDMRKEQEQLDEDLVWLMAKIKQLNPIDQELMILSVQSGLSDEEIGKQLGISADNVRVRRYRIRKQIKQLAESEKENHDG